MHEHDFTPSQSPRTSFDGSTFDGSTFAMIDASSKERMPAQDYKVGWEGPDDPENPMVCIQSFPLGIHA
jgi:hypothetical protein